MLGLKPLEEFLTLGSDEKVSLWLEAGLRSIGTRQISEGVELAFTPLILQRAESPMEQFHSAFEAMNGAVQAKIRFSCGQLLTSIRDTDDPNYLQILWSLSAALLPSFGVIAPARMILAIYRMQKLNRNEIEPIIDAMVVALLGYAPSDETSSLVAEIRGSELWRQTHAEQYAVFLAQTSGLDWPAALKTIEQDIRPLVGERHFFWRRLATSIGQFGFVANLELLKNDQRLQWLRDALSPYLELHYRGGAFEVVLSGHRHPVPFDRLSPDPSMEAMITLMASCEPAAPADDALNRLEKHLKLRPR
jgi:hypothetical protein